MRELSSTATSHLDIFLFVLHYAAKFRRSLLMQRDLLKCMVNRSISNVPPSLGAVTVPWLHSVRWVDGA